MGHKGKWIILVVVLFASVLFAHQPAEAANICTWSPSLGNEWLEISNWSNCGGTVPQADDEVIISNTGTDPVLEGTTAVAKVTIESDATLIITTPYILTTNEFDLYGTLNNAGTLTVTHRLDWNTAGRIIGSGTTQIASTAILYLAGYGVDLVSQTIENDGIFNWNGPSTIWASSGAHFLNTSNGTVNADATSESVVWHDMLNATSFQNNGIFNATVANTNGVVMRTAFDNDGTFNLTGNGGARLTYGTINSGTFQTYEPAILFIGSTDIPEQNFTFTNTSAILGWYVQFEKPGTINVDGAYAVSGSDSNTVISGQYGGSSTVNFNNSTTGNNLGEKVHSSSATLNINLSGSLTIPTLTQINSTLNGSTPLTISNLYTCGAFCNIKGTGSLTINPSATMRLLANNSKYINGRSITNNGTFEWKDDCDIVASNSATITNNGTFDIQGNAGLTGGSDATFNNYGTLIKSGGILTTTIGVDFNNFGEIRQETGHLAFTENDLVIPSGEITTLNEGTLTTGGLLDIQGGILNGNGTIIGDVQNGGLVAPGFSPGDITIQGNYTQTISGTVEIQMGIWEDNLTIDQFEIEGHASLTGTLQLAIMDTYNPAIDETFKVMGYDSHTGTFATLNLPTLTNKAWEVAYETDGVYLTVVEPRDYYIYLPIIIK